MNIIGLLFLLSAHYFSGRGILHLFRVKLPALQLFCLSMIVGVAALSFVPCFLQLVHQAITVTTVCIGIGILTFLCTIPLLTQLKLPAFSKIALPPVYEWPFIALILFLALVSVWRCFYYPPVSRDMLTGPELIAEYTVREGTMVNSVFSIDLSTTNNYLKSPYITCLQIIYKLLVDSFGQLWLSVIFVSFTGFLYSVLRRCIHPIIAGMLMLFFITIPELYAYTYLMLYDYSNMVFFFFGFYFLVQFRETRNVSNFALSCFLFGLATYIRTETLVLVVFTLPLLVFMLYKMKMAARRLLIYSGIFLLSSAYFYFLCMNVFVHNFVPLPYDVSAQVNPHLLDISVFFRRIWDICTFLIFSKLGVVLYGYFIFLFCTVLIIDICWLRRFNKASAIALYGIAVVFFGVAFLGYLLPLYDLDNTSKRGLFKLLPLMVLYLCNSGSLLRLSDIIAKWQATGAGKESTEAEPADL